MHVISVIYGEETDIADLANNGRPIAKATVMVHERKNRSPEKGHPVCLGYKE